jgi:hypothetical protein
MLLLELLSYFSYRMLFSELNNLILYSKQLNLLTVNLLNNHVIIFINYVKKLVLLI